MIMSDKTDTALDEREKFRRRWRKDCKTHGWMPEHFTVLRILSDAYALGFLNYHQYDEIMDRVYRNNRGGWMFTKGDDKTFKTSIIP
jgi:hypothetical protein